MASTTRSKRIAAVSVVALAAGLCAAAPSGAQSIQLGYRCGLNTFGSFDTSVTLDTTAPASAFAGQGVSTTLTVAMTFEDSTTNVLLQFGAATIEGTAQATIHAGGTDVLSNLAWPATQVGYGTMYTLTGPLTVSGSDVASGLSLSAGDITVDLVFKTATGTVRLSPDGTCRLDPQQNATIDTMALSKDETATKVKAAGIASGRVAKAKVTIAGEHGGDATGKVKAVLFRSGVKVASDSAHLKDGRAVLKFGKITRTGKYKVKVSYAGNASFGDSKGKASFEVG